MSGRKTKAEDDLPGHFPWMIEYARKFVPAADAEDVALEALRDAYDDGPSRPPAAEIKRVKGWLGTLVRFRVLDFWKREKKRAPETCWDHNDDELAVAHPFQFEENLADRQWIRLAWPHLSEERQELMFARYVEEVTSKELADERGVSEYTVRSWLRRARLELGARMQELLDGTRRRLGMLFPLWFLGMDSAEKDVAARGRFGRGMWRGLGRIFGPPLRLAASVGAGVSIVGFTPSGPWAARDERIEVATQAEIRGEAVLIRIPASEGGSPTTATEKQTEGAPRKPSRALRDVVRSADSVGDTDFSMIVHAKVALDRGNARKAIEVLDEHACKYPQSPNAEERRILRAAAVKALAEKQ